MSVPPTEAHKARARELVRQRQAARIPSAAIEAGTRALYYYNDRPVGTRDPEEAARAVLEAASERIECPKCEGSGSVDDPWRPDPVNTARWRQCSRCGGSGFLFILRTEPHESG